jgi:mycofactocin system glycosyltransferase
MSTLSYGLGKGTSVRVDEDGVHLVLGYPLKVITIHSVWRDIFDRLNNATFVPLTELEMLQTSVSRKKIAEFLNQLVLKGFLQRIGMDEPKDYPRLSIIIPVRNRATEIGDCLTSLQKISYPVQKVEIIVVDDASEDATPIEVGKHPVRLIRLKHHKQASFCRNLGAKFSTGKILAFIDSDCIADPMWLAQLLPAFEDPLVAAVGGRVDSYYEDKRLDLYEKVKSSLIVSSYPKRSDQSDPFFYVPACNFLVRQDVFSEIGGFNIHLSVGEDVDLCWRLRKSHHEFEFRPEGIVFHKHRNRLSAFCKRRFDYGTSEPLLQKIHDDKVKQFIVPMSATGFWCLIFLWTLTNQPMLIVGGLLLAIVDCLVKNHRYKRFKIGLSKIFIATLRSYAAFIYNVCAFMSRYYLILGIVCAPLSLMLTLVVVSMHILNCLVEYRLKKARLNFPWFLGFFTLEQISYQAGVWMGCLRHRFFSPVSPKLVTDINRN